MELLGLLMIASAIAAFLYHQSTPADWMFILQIDIGLVVFLLILKFVKVYTYRSRVSKKKIIKIEEV